MDVQCHHVEVAVNAVQKAFSRAEHVIKRGRWGCFRVLPAVAAASKLSLVVSFGGSYRWICTSDYARFTRTLQRRLVPSVVVFPEFRAPRITLGCVLRRLAWFHVICEKDRQR